MLIRLSPGRLRDNLPLRLASLDALTIPGFLDRSGQPAMVRSSNKTYGS